MPAPAYDAAWLSQLRHRKRTGGPWEADMHGFLAFMRRIACSQIRWISRLKGRPAQPADKDDILSLANARFVRAGIDQYQGRSAPATFYLAIVRNTTASYHRPPWRRNEVPATGPVDLAPRDRGLEEGQRHELWHDMLAALGRAYEIKPEWAQAVDLFLFQQLGSATECAARIGISEANFNQRVSRGRLLLQRLLLEGGYP